MSMSHVNTYHYGLEIRQFIDTESPSGNAWIVDLMDGAECIGEAAGVAPVLMNALTEAAQALSVEIADGYLAERLN